jgi:hypothetical protein
MTTKETRQYEMLVRIRKFGEAHRDLFPKKTDGGQAFAAVAEAVTRLSRHDASKMKTAEEGRQTKATARAALLDQLKAISRTAGLIADSTPDFENRFNLPRAGKQTDQALLTAGAVFREEAGAMKQRFISCGMPTTFIADLEELVTKFGQTVEGRATGKKEQMLAHAGITAALSSGLHAARALDIIVANQLRGDAETLKAWEIERKVDLRRRPKSRATEPASTPTVSTVTSSAASTPPVTTTTPLAASPAPAGLPAPAAERGQAPSDPGTPGEAGPAGKAA